MQGAEAEDEVDAVDADDLAIGEQLGQGIEGDAVGRIVERRNEHDSVGDVEIGIAGRQPLALENNGRGMGSSTTWRGCAVLVAGVLQPAQVVLERLVVRVVGTRLDDGDDGSRPDEPRQVVDVAMGVVALDAPAEPDDMADSEIVGEDLLELRAVEPGLRAWISLSRHSSVASRVPRPLTSIAPPSITTRTRRPACLRPAAPSAADPSQLAILRGRRLSRTWLSYLAQPLNFQSIEADCGVAVGRGSSLTTNVGAGVAQPAPVGRGLEEPDRLEVDADGVELVGHAIFHRAAADDDVNAFDAAQVADDLGVDPARSARTCRASRRGCAARRSRSPRAAPIRRACGNRVRRASGPLRPSSHSIQSRNRSVIGP